MLIIYVFYGVQLKPVKKNYYIILTLKAHYEYGFLCKKKTTVEVIKECAFGGTCFREIYSSVNGKWSRKSWKEFDELGDIDQKYYCSNYYDVSVNKYGLQCGKSL